jgi:hypothetical protein
MLSTLVNVYVGRLLFIYIIHSWNNIITALATVRKYSAVINLILTGALEVQVIANKTAGS